MPTEMTRSPETAAADVLPADWGEHVDPAGFVVQVPAGWLVQAPTPGEIVIGDPLGFAAALVRVRRLPPRTELAPWLARQYAATEPGLHNVRMLRVEGRGPRVAHAAFDYGSSVFQGRASVVAAREGDLVTIFIAAAARDQFARSLPLLVRILESFSFDTPRAARVAGVQRFAQWADPYEGAMLAAMPDGWRAHGGVLRSAWNTRIAVTASSADDAVQVFFGDPTLPRRFVVPASAGAPGPQGGPYPGADAEMVVAFRRAEALGAELVKSRFGAHVIAIHPRRDLLYVARRNPLLQGGGAASTSAADLEFRLADGRVGLLTLMTFGVAVEHEGGAWWADGLHGFVTPGDRKRIAANAMLTLVASLRENPQRVVPLEAGTSRVEREFQDHLRWLRDLQHAVTTARLLADDAREEALRGEVPDWKSQSGLTLERLLAIGNVVADR